MAIHETRRHETAGLVLPAFGYVEPERVLVQDDLFAVLKDKFPVAPGHSLIVPKRSVARFHELSTAEKSRLMEWVDWTQQHLQTTLSPSPDGFNFGLNDGRAAGQTMPQFHFHVIPRYTNDVVDPRGGVRWVVPKKAEYWNRNECGENQ